MSKKEGYDPEKRGLRRWLHLPGNPYDSTRHPALDTDQSGKADLKTQNAYLQKVIRLKSDEIAELKLRIETLKLELLTESNQIKREIAALQLAARKLTPDMVAPGPLKKSWWRRIFGR